MVPSSWFHRLPNHPDQQVLVTSLPSILYLFQGGSNQSVRTWSLDSSIFRAQVHARINPMGYQELTSNHRQACKGLRSLCYSPGGKFRGPVNFTLADLVELLELHKASLEELTFGDQADWHSSRDHPELLAL